MTTITIPNLDESIERMKQEIIDDIKAGRVHTSGLPLIFRLARLRGRQLLWWFLRGG